MHDLKNRGERVGRIAQLTFMYKLHSQTNWTANSLWVAHMGALHCSEPMSAHVNAQQHASPGCWRLASRLP